MGVLSGIMIYFKAFQKRRASETVLSGKLLVGAVAISEIEYRFICVCVCGGVMLGPLTAPSKAWVLCKLPVEEGRLSLVGAPLPPAWQV